MVKIRLWVLKLPEPQEVGTKYSRYLLPKASLAEGFQVPDLNLLLDRARQTTAPDLELWGWVLLVS